MTTMSFNEKAVIVTGATSGIGRATAEAFGREGAALVLVGRNERALEQTAATISAAGGRSVSCAVDITTVDAAGRVVKAADDAFGGIDVLVNAAGVIASGTVESTSDDTWEQMLAVNVTRSVPFDAGRCAGADDSERIGRQRVKRERAAFLCRCACVLRQ